MKKLKKSGKVKRKTVWACNCASYCMRSCASSCGSSPSDYQTQDQIIYDSNYLPESYIH